MRSLHISTLALALALASSARAETFVLDSTNRPSVDPAATFEADCLGDSEADDCAARAALLESELVELLGTLEGLSDTDTVALFKAAAAIDDPRLQTMALRYFAYRSEVPADLWTRIKEFFLGPDATVGQPAAEALQRSLDDVDQELAELYLAGRPSSGYGGDLPSATGEGDSWADAEAKDARLDAVVAFAEEQRFTPAARLLMVDRFITAPLDVETQIPVTGFVTDASVADVSAHFTQLFGKEPYPPLATAVAQQTSLSNELLELQQRALNGDTSVSERIQELLLELEKIQAGVGVGSVLQLEELGCADHAFWFDGTVDDLYGERLPRAVTVGTDALLGRTAIRYIGPEPSVGPSPGDGDPGMDGSAGDGDGDGDGGGEGSDGPKGGSDGGCAVSAGAGGPALLWLAIALLIATRRRLWVARER